jgi:hypothetical protein
MSRKTQRLRELFALDRVRCLECGTIYAKPAGGGTVQENPGCPKCGYLGWITETLPASRPARPRCASGHRPPGPARFH